MTTADIILKQLGGNEFLAMTGAKNLVEYGNALRMTLPKNKSKANRLEITLDPDDTYTMNFYNYRQGTWKVNYKNCTVTEIPEKYEEIYKVSGIYFDKLVEIFERTTQMHTKLF